MRKIYRDGETVDVSGEGVDESSLDVPRLVDYEPEEINLRV